MTILERLRVATYAVLFTAFTAYAIFIFIVGTATFIDTLLWFGPVIFK